MNLPKSFTDLVNNLTMLPGVGQKTAERYAYSIYDKEIEDIENLSESLISFKKNIKNCNICGCLSDYDTCEICSEKTRDKSTICIVEDSKNVKNPLCEFECGEDQDMNKCFEVFYDKFKHTRAL